MQTTGIHSCWEVCFAAGRRLGKSEVLVDKGVEALTIPGRNLERALVRYDDYDLPQRVVQDRTAVASLQVSLNLGTKHGIDLMIDEIRQLL